MVDEGLQILKREWFTGAPGPYSVDGLRGLQILKRRWFTGAPDP